MIDDRRVYYIMMLVLFTWINLYNVADGVDAYFMDSSTSSMQLKRRFHSSFHTMRNSNHAYLHQSVTTTVYGTIYDDYDNDNDDSRIQELPVTTTPIAQPEQKQPPFIITTIDVNSSSRSSSPVEIAAKMTISQIISLIGIIYAIGILLVLAMDDHDSIMATIEATLTLTTTSSSSSSYIPELIEDLTKENLFHATDNIIDIALPPLSSPSEAVIMALGEGIAGIIGSFVSCCLSLILMYRSNNNKDKMTILQDEELQGLQSNDEGMIVPEEDGRVDKTDSLDEKQLYHPQSIFNTLDVTGTSSIQASGISAASTTPAEEAVAGSDFFLAQAATLSIAENLGGLSPLYASIVSVLLATIPYELIKITSRNARMKSQTIQQDELLVELIREEEDRKQNSKIPFVVGFPTKTKPSYSVTNYPTIITATPAVVNPVYMQNNRQLQSSSPTSLLELDAVELFSDVTKWLEYSVLRSEFRGSFNMFLSNTVEVSAKATENTSTMAASTTTTTTLLVHGITHNMILNNIIESAMFGVFAAISAQLYADLLYGWFGFGGPLKKYMIRTRTTQEWSQRYITIGISSAALFGIYEAAQDPVREWITAVTSL